MKQNFKPRKRKNIREVDAKKSYSGEASPYWEFMAATTEKRTHGDDIIEHPLANPDVLDSSASLYERPLTELGELQMEAVRQTVDRLSPQELRVYELLLRDGKTQEKTAELLGTTRRNVREALSRVSAKIKKTFEILSLQERQQ